MARSPISAPNILDKSPVPTTAVARAHDEVLWALIELLLQAGAIKRDQLITKLDAVLQEVKSSGTLKTQEDNDLLATSLAIDRVIRALSRLPS
jgi:hypothetical protein